MVFISTYHYYYYYPVSHFWTANGILPLMIDFLAIGVKFSYVRLNECGDGVWKT